MNFLETRIESYWKVIDLFDKVSPVPCVIRVDYKDGRAEVLDCQLLREGHIIRYYQKDRSSQKKPAILKMSKKRIYWLLLPRNVTHLDVIKMRDVVLINQRSIVRFLGYQHGARGLPLWTNHGLVSKRLKGKR